MEKFRRTLGKFEKAVGKFEEALESLKEWGIPEELLVEVITKRFEYTFESMWKTVKEYLRFQGIECNSPRSCFKEALKEGIVPLEYESCLYRMIILRNFLVHVYSEEQAKEIY